EHRDAVGGVAGSACVVPGRGRVAEARAAARGVARHALGGEQPAVAAHHLTRAVLATAGVEAAVRSAAERPEREAVTGGRGAARAAERPEVAVFPGGDVDGAVAAAEARIRAVQCRSQ